MPEPLLSICIPTHNRATLLQKTLESITNQAHFIDTGEVEIIISDNCCDDDTRSIGTLFASTFPTKVKYHRNSTNVGAGNNFEIALLMASGEYLKLHNDNLLIRNGSLTEILKVIKATSIFQLPESAQ